MRNFFFLTLFKIGLLLLLVVPLPAVEPIEEIDGQSVVDYIMRCRKENGAFGPLDQSYTDAAWNFPAVATLKRLGIEIDHPGLVLENGLGYPEGHVGYGHWQFFHLHRIRELLGVSTKTKHGSVRLVHQGFREVRYYGSPFGTDGKTFFQAGGEGLDPRDAGAKELGYYNLSSLCYLLDGLRASGRMPSNFDELAKFVQDRQAKNGGFVDVRTDSGSPVDHEAHLVHTYQALAILDMLECEVPDPGACLDFIQLCESGEGGFHAHPDMGRAGNSVDIYYTWAAIKGLALLGKKSGSTATCLKWINSLQNADGGFGDQPGWRSRLYSTWYAVDALATLEEDNPIEAITRKARAAPEFEAIPEVRFRVFRGLNKFPVIDASKLETVSEIGLDLIALKSNDFTLAEDLLKALVKARSSKSLDVVLCPELYPHRARRHGGALVHHIANPMLDPRWSSEKRSRWKTVNSAGTLNPGWDEYREKVIRPLRLMGSIIYPEQDFEMEYAYSAYDAGLQGEAGYNAILAGFNWAPCDFVRVFPWRERYTDKLTPVADVDAHGDLEKWLPHLDRVRHLFIAESCHYRDFLEAAQNGRVVCAIRNLDDQDGEPLTYYGPGPAVKFVKKHISRWCWW